MIVFIDFSLNLEVLKQSKVYIYLVSRLHREGFQDVREDVRSCVNLLHGLNRDKKPVCDKHMPIYVKPKIHKTIFICVLRHRMLVH